MLIRSPRQTRRDLERWMDLVETDALLATTDRMSALEDRGLEALRLFWRRGPFFVSTSWGKDSVVVAHLAWRLHAEGINPELIWFPAGPIENPDCVSVRDEFLRRWPCRYREIVAAPDGDYSAWLGHDGAQREFERASKMAGPRYASGVRAAESAVREMRMVRWGECSPNTCAPIGRWPTEYVFAYAHRHDLPLHPAYACLRGGVIERHHIRVGTLGGRRGTGWGRREWEMTYYRDEMIALGLEK